MRVQASQSVSSENVTVHIFPRRGVMRDPDDILSLAELAKVLQLDPRTVKRVATQLGGKCFGTRWRFRWGTVMRYFNNANDPERPRKPVDGQDQYQRRAGGEPDVSGRKKGPEWTAARLWEVETKAAIQALLEQGLTLPLALTKLGLQSDLHPKETTPAPQTHTVSDGLITWGDKPV